MTRYRISNPTFDVEVGVFSGNTQEDALDEMACKYGYRNYAHMKSQPYGLGYDRFVVQELPESESEER